MKTLQTYQAEDGSRFDEPEKCLAYEQDSEALGDIMVLLKPRPTGTECNFENGSGYVQQNKYTILKCYGAVLSVVRGKIVPEETVANIERVHAFAPYSIIGRYLSDCDHKAANAAWHRFMCIDEQWREWGQPFFAKHPNAGEQVEISQQ